VERENDHKMRDVGQFCASLHSAALCALDKRLRSLENTNRIELSFRARLPNGGLQVEIV
jgi:hypothetical protein